MADSEAVTVETPVFQGPALNATSDAPVVVETPDPPPVSVEVTTLTDGKTPNTEEPTEATPETAAEEGDAGITDTGDTGQPTAEIAGNKDETPAPIKREITKERNRRRDAEARADRAEKLAEEANAKAMSALQALEDAERARTAEATRQAAETPRPQRQSFDSPDAYEEALIAWTRATEAAKYRQAEAGRQAKQAEEEKARTAKAQQDAQQKAQQERIEGWQGKRKAFIEKHPDFVEVAESDDVKISNAMTSFIIEADNGPEIAYYLGQHPEDSARIASLSPAKAGIELGKLVVSIEAAKAPKVSKAPRPATPVQSRNAAAPKSADEMSMDEYAAMRNPVLMRERLGPSARARAT